MFTFLPNFVKSANKNELKKKNTINYDSLLPLRKSYFYCKACGLT